LKKLNVCLGITGKHRRCDRRNHSIVVLVALGIAGLFFYFLPTLIAVSGNHRQWGTISIINIFFGWTLIAG
jgi:hypothetical protein